MGAGVLYPIIGVNSALRQLGPRPLWIVEKLMVFITSLRREHNGGHESIDLVGCFCGSGGADSFSLGCSLVLDEV